MLLISQFSKENRQFANEQICLTVSVNQLKKWFHSSNDWTIDFPQRCKNVVLSASSVDQRAMTSSVCSSSQRASCHDISVYSEISGGGRANGADGRLASSHDPITKLFSWVSDATTVTLSCICWGVEVGGGAEQRDTGASRGARRRRRLAD